MAVLGMDVGGTRTRVVIESAAGGARQRGEAEGANPVRVGPEAAVERMQRALDGALSGARELLDHDPLSGLCVGLSGLSHPDAEVIVRRGLAALDPLPDHFLLVDDLRLPLEAAFDGGPGVLVLAGTGSGALARLEETIHRLGGLGPRLGDEGSGYVLVLEALRAVARAEEGLGPATQLRELLFAALEVESYRQLPALVASGIPLALHFGALLEAEATGDGVAISLLEAGGEALARLGLAAAEKAGLESGRVATAGGALGASERLRSALARALAERGDLRLDVHVEDPVEGALRLARGSRGGAGE